MTGRIRLLVRPQTPPHAPRAAESAGTTALSPRVRAPPGTLAASLRPRLDDLGSAAAIALTHTIIAHAPTTNLKVHFLPTPAFA